MNVNTTDIAKDFIPVVLDTAQHLLREACEPSTVLLLKLLDGKPGYGFLRVASEISGDGLQRIVVQYCPPAGSPADRKPVPLLVIGGDENIEPNDKEHGWFLRACVDSERNVRTLFDTKEINAEKVAAFGGGLKTVAEMDAAIASYVTASKLAVARMLVGIETLDPLLARTADYLVAANGSTFLLESDLHPDNPLLRLSVSPPVMRSDCVAVPLAVLGEGPLSAIVPTVESERRAAWFFDAMALLAAPAGQ